jgi:hypothetical protein
METHDGERDTGKGRVRRLYDELTAVLRRLAPERREAFRKYLSDEQEQETTDDSRDAAAGD